MLLTTQGKRIPLYHPAIPFILSYLEEQYRLLLSQTKNKYQQDNLKYQFENIKPDDIYVEYIENLNEYQNKVLTCFTVPSRGFGYLDVPIPLGDYKTLLNALQSDIRKFNNFKELVDYVKSGNEVSGLIEIKGRTQLGVLIDPNLSGDLRQQALLKSLGYLDYTQIKVQYNNVGITESLPISGSVYLNHFLMKPEIFDLYDKEDIKKLS